MWPTSGDGRETPRGHGLADIKGHDPMDRRIEVEKKERYARELREQMNSRCTTPVRGAENTSLSGLAGIGSSVLNSRQSFGSRQGSPLMGRSDSNGNLDPAVTLAKAGSFSGWNGSGQPARSSSEGPPSETWGSRGSPQRSGGLPPRAAGDGHSESWGTAGKVAALQDMIRDRLKSLEEQQRLQWERLQAVGGPEVKREAEATARAAVENAMEAMRQRQRDDLKRVTDEAREAMRASLAPEIQRLSQQLQAQGAEMARMRRCECRDEVQRLSQQLEAQAAELARSRRQCEELQRLSQQLEAQGARLGQQLERQSADMANLRRPCECHEEIQRLNQRLEKQGARLNQQLEAQGADMAKLRRPCEELSNEVSRLHQRLEAQGERLSRQLEAQGADMANLRRPCECHEEIQRLNQRLEKQSSRLNQQLEAQGSDMAKLRRVSEDIGGIHADIADLRGRVEGHDDTLHHLERTKADRSELRDRLEEKENALSQMRRVQSEVRQELESRAHEVSNLRQAIASVRDELAQARHRHPEPLTVREEPIRVRQEPRPAPPPPSQPRPPSPSPVYKRAPKETYVILWNADDDVHYLCTLENTIGRATTCNVVVTKSQSISGQHASIQVSSGGAVLRDLGSRNGTWINERRVGPHEGLKLESGDSIQLGIDGPCYFFEWGPAAAKILPRDYEGAPHRMGGSRR